MKSGFLSLLVAVVALAAFPAFAMGLHEARAAGAVGEKLDGYVAAIRPSAEVKSLVDDVNAKRKQEYERISRQNGQPVEVVAKLAAQEIISSLVSGSFYQSPDGGWRRR